MSDNDLTGRVALVTGASGHLGGYVCQALAGRGATVVGTRHQSPGPHDPAGPDGGAGDEPAAPPRTGTGGPAHLLEVDLTDPVSATTLLSRVRQIAGPPDIVVCAHGGTRRQGVLEPGGTDQRLWTLNTQACFALATAAAKAMLRRRYGRIVLLGSRAGLVGLPGQAAYAATKAALSGWAASAAWELGPFGITVNVVAPGAIEPDPRADAGVYTKEEDDAVAARTAVRRLGTAAEVAAVVAFLAGPAAGFVTGQTIAVDGGARW